MSGTVDAGRLRNSLLTTAIISVKYQIKTLVDSEDGREGLEV